MQGLQSSKLKIKNTKNIVNKNFIAILKDDLQCVHKDPLYKQPPKVNDL